MNFRTFNLSLIRIQMLFIVVCLTIFASDSFSQNETPSTDSIPIPRYLYSWTTPESLLKRAHELNQSTNKKWPGFGRLGEDTVVAQGWPKILQAEQALFAWSTVLSPTGPSTEERYGEVLVRFEIDPEKVKAVYLSDQQLNDSNNIDFLNVDLVFHEKKRFREWILLNLDAVVSVTADPLLMKNELLDALRKLKDDKYKFSKGEVHGNFHYDLPKGEGGIFIEANSRKNAIYRIQKFLTEGRHIVPSIFLENSNHDEAGLRQRIRAFKVQDYIRYQQESEKNEMLGWSEIDDYSKWGTLKRIVALRRAIAFFANDHLGLNLENWDDFLNRIEVEFDKVDDELGRNPKKDKIIELKKSLFDRKITPIANKCEALFSG